MKMANKAPGIVIQRIHLQVRRQGRPGRRMAFGFVLSAKQRSSRTAGKGALSQTATEPTLRSFFASLYLEDVGAEEGPELSPCEECTGE